MLIGEEEKKLVRKLDGDTTHMLLATDNLYHHHCHQCHHQCHHHCHHRHHHCHHCRHCHHCHHCRHCHNRYHHRALALEVVMMTTLVLASTAGVKGTTLEAHPVGQKCNKPPSSSSLSSSWWSASPKKTMRPISSMMSVSFFTDQFCSSFHRLPEPDPMFFFCTADIFLHSG